MGLFDGIKKKINKAQFEDMIKEAVADGKISAIEKKDLIEQAAKVGYDEAEAMEVIEEQLRESQISLFTTEVEKAMRDGQFSEAEQLKLTQLAESFGLDTEVASGIINVKYAEYQDKRNQELQFDNLLEQVQLDQDGQVSLAYLESCVESAKALGFKQQSVEKKLRMRFGQRCLFNIKMSQFQAESVRGAKSSIVRDKILKEAAENGFTADEISMLNEMMAPDDVPIQNNMMGQNNMGMNGMNNIGMNGMNNMGMNGMNNMGMNGMNNRGMNGMNNMGMNGMMDQNNMGNIIPENDQKSRKGEILKDVGIGLGAAGVAVAGTVLVNKAIQNKKEQNQIDMSADPVVTLMDGRKVKKSQVPMGVVYINEFGQKVQKKQVQTPTAATSADPIVTLMDGRKVNKSQVPMGVVYINEFGQKVQKKQVQTPTAATSADPIVTLMDGRKVKKSQVPNGVVYINENGQKVKKVVK